MAIFHNLCVRLRFESSKYFNVFLRLKSSHSLTLQSRLKRDSFSDSLLVLHLN